MSIWIVTGLHVFLAFVFSLSVIVRKRDPAVTLAWLLAFFLFPFVGVTAFAFFGYQRFRLRRRTIPQPVHRLTLAESPENTPSPEHRSIVALATGLTGYPVTHGNQVTIFSRSAETDQALIQAFREARHHIHMCYYIFEPDSEGIFFRDLLTECAGRGVECRLLMDSVGSFSVSEDFLSPLRAAGGHAAFFNPFQTFKRPWAFHFRNHKKLSVIDGKIGFLGSQNIGHNFWRSGSRRLRWRETDLRLEGPAVTEMQTVFAEDWQHSDGENLVGPSYFPSVPKPGKALVQVLPTGPDGQENNLALIFLEALHTAQKRVTITTPYLIPTPAMALALKGAARRGVTVEILVPHLTDHPVVTWAARSWFKEFIESGVIIYQHKETFVHSKVVTVDGSLALVGSANMDTRSFLINFELSLLLYDKTATHHLESEFNQMVTRSVRVQHAHLTRQPLWKNLAEGTCRMFSPLL